MAEGLTATGATSAASPQVRARLRASCATRRSGGDRGLLARRRDTGAARTWSEHRDINEVMLATSLAPEGFLERAPPR